MHLRAVLHELAAVQAALLHDLHLVAVVALLDHHLAFTQHALFECADDHVLVVRVHGFEDERVLQQVEQ